MIRSRKLAQDSPYDWNNKGLGSVAKLFAGRIALICIVALSAIDDVRAWEILELDQATIDGAKLLDKLELRRSKKLVAIQKTRELTTADCESLESEYREGKRRADRLVGVNTSDAFITVTEFIKAVSVAWRALNVNRVIDDMAEAMVKQKPNLMAQNVQKEMIAEDLKERLQTKKNVSLALEVASKAGSSAEALTASIRKTFGNWEPSSWPVAAKTCNGNKVEWNSSLDDTEYATDLADNVADCLASSTRTFIGEQLILTCFGKSAHSLYRSLEKTGGEGNIYEIRGSIPNKLFIFGEPEREAAFCEQPNYGRKPPYRPKGVFTFTNQSQKQVDELLPKLPASRQLFDVLPVNENFKKALRTEQKQ